MRSNEPIQVKFYSRNSLFVFPFRGKVVPLQGKIEIIDKPLRMELNTLIAECTTYDFKVMLEEKKPKSWLKSVSAFANGLGGSLFYGIDNDGIVKGLDDVQHVCETISSKIRDYMDPLPEVEMIPHDIDDLHILQLKVNAGHLLHITTLVMANA